MAVALLSVFFLATFQAFTSARSPALPPFVGELSKEKVCFHDDELYKPWEKFADKACTGWCMCNGESGSVGCVSLCPPSPVPMCSLGSVHETRVVPSADPTGRCTCKRQFCSSRPSLLRPPLPPHPGKLQIRLHNAINLQSDGLDYVSQITWQTTSERGSARSKCKTGL